MTPEETTKFDKMYDEIHELTLVMKGYNGYRGVAAMVTDHEEEITKLRACFEPLTKIPDTVEALKTSVSTLQTKPGSTALKWLNRIGVALLGAAAVALFTLLLDTRAMLVQHDVVNKQRSQSTTQSSP